LEQSTPGLQPTIALLKQGLQTQQQLLRVTESKYGNLVSVYKYLIRNVTALSQSYCSAASLLDGLDCLNVFSVMELKTAFFRHLSYLLPFVAEGDVKDLLIKKMIALDDFCIKYSHLYHQSQDRAVDLGIDAFQKLNELIADLLNFLEAKNLVTKAKTPTLYTLCTIIRMVAKADDYMSRLVHGGYNFWYWRSWSTPLLQNNQSTYETGFTRQSKLDYLYQEYLGVTPLFEYQPKL